MATPTPKVLFLMADYGHDPTETAVPYAVFKNSGFTVHFATEKGVAPKCDDKMLYGLTQKLLVCLPIHDGPVFGLRYIGDNNTNLTGRKEGRSPTIRNHAQRPRHPAT